MTESGRVSFQDLKAGLVARGCIIFLLFFAFVIGIWVGGSVLHDPDTCWLLAVGKQIIDSGTIPFVDSFSYTFPHLASDGAINYATLTGSGTPEGGRIFVAYQWLSEVLFYLSYMVGAGYGVVVLSCVLLITAFIVFPLFVFRNLKSSMIVGIMLVVFGVVASSFHFVARPEIYSYCWWALTLFLLAKYRYDYEIDQPSYKTILFIPLILLVWANMHTGFTYAFLALGFFCLTQTLETVIRKEKPGKYIGFAWLALVLSFLATLLNPNGFGLWAYLPELFFSPMNKYIEELKPISMKDLTEWTYYPFFIVSAAVIGILVRNITIWAKKRHLPRSWLFSILTIITAVGGGIVSRRVITFDTIFLVFEAAWLLRHTGVPIWEAGQEHDEHDTLLHIADHKLSNLMKESTWVVLVMVFALLGVYLSTSRIVPPTIPQGEGVVSSPKKLMNFIARQDKDLGRLFNDPQIGDMIIWYLQTTPRSALLDAPWRPKEVKYAPKVFIDTRHDMYGYPLVNDYYIMANCQKGWKELFEKYNFDWVVLRKKQNLAKALMKDSSWKVVYKDTSAVILVRNKRPEEPESQPE